MMKNRNITAGKTIALEREVMFKMKKIIMNVNKHLSEMRSLSCSVFGTHL